MNKRLVYTAVIEHKHGQNTYVALTEKQRDAEIVEFCRDWAEHEGIDIVGLNIADAITTYFNQSQEEYLWRDHIYVDDFFTTLEMEAALCVWEWINEITVIPAVPDPEWMGYRENIGSVELRHESMKIGRWCLAVYEHLPEWYCASGAYDWEIIPAIFGELTPAEPYPADHKAVAQHLITKPSAIVEWTRGFEFRLKHDYGLQLNDVVVGDWLDPLLDPEEQAKAYAEKFNLERISR